MNRKDTIAMALEAGFEEVYDSFVCDPEDIERFAALVAAAERDSWPAEMEAMERQVNILTDELATPPAAQRQWVGMTEEEMQQACYEAFSYDPYVIARAIEAKLREKNGGQA